MKPLETDYELARLAVGYLCFPEICPKLPSTAVREALLLGSYSWYEYAVSFWVSHLWTWLHEPSKEGQIVEIAEDLEVLLDLHYSRPQNPQSISKTIHEKLRSFSKFGIYNDLAQAVVFSRKQLASRDREESGEHTLQFPNITAHIRSELERMLSTELSADAHSTLKKYYGTGLFKFPHLNCQYFYKGFDDRHQRDRHTQRHDRAYNCIFEGCPTAVFGCLSKRDLDRHMLEIHGVIGDEPDFPDFKNSYTPRGQLQHSDFQCGLCSKKFTRKHNLASHFRSHSDNRPFKCETCGLAFVRKNDRKRHERLHGDSAAFFCGGTLDSGESWGCGKYFARADTLKSHHFDGVTRHSCIRPLLEERSRLQKAIEQTLQAGNTPSSSQSTDSSLVDSGAMISNDTSPPSSPLEPRLDPESTDSTAHIRSQIEGDPTKHTNPSDGEISSSYYKYVEREYIRLYKSLDI